ncbi:MAG: MoaD/ThiS family protein [Planctomycetota bacterium]
MIVRVQTFGPLRETLGEWVEVEAETVADVKRAVPGTYAVAVNLEYAGDEVVIGEGDEVALIPPVSGGGGGGCRHVR